MLQGSPLEEYLSGRKSVLLVAVYAFTTGGFVVLLDSHKQPEIPTATDVKRPIWLPSLTSALFNAFQALRLAVHETCRLIDTRTQETAALQAASAIVRSQCLLDDDALTIYDLDERPFQDAPVSSARQLWMPTLAMSTSAAAALCAYRSNWSREICSGCNMVAIGTASWCARRLYRCWWTRSHHLALRNLIANTEATITALHSTLKAIQRVELGTLRLDHDSFSPSLPLRI